MPEFIYKARDATGAAVDGMLDIDTRDGLDNYFLENNLIPIKVDEKKPKGASVSAFSFRKKLSDVDLIAFTRQFSAAYSAGISITESLQTLVGQITHVEFKKAIQEMIAKIQQGYGLTEVFSEYPYFFDPTYISIIKAGETTGQLDNALMFCANLLEKKMLHKERIKGAFLYPKIVLGVMSVVIVVIISYVIPQFAKLYAKFNAELPFTTRILIDTSNLFQEFWWLWAKVGLQLTSLFPLSTQTRPFRALSSP